MSKNPIIKRAEELLSEAVVASEREDWPTVVTLTSEAEVLLTSVNAPPHILVPLAAIKMLAEDQVNKATAAAA